MKTSIACICALVLFMAGCGKSEEKSGKDASNKSEKGKADWPLDELKGKNPVLVAVVDNQTNPRYKEFFDQWASVEAEAKKHNLVIIEVFGNNDNRSGRIRGGRSFSLR